MSVIKLGFVGCGFVAQQCHLPCFSANKSFQIIGIADPHPNLREFLGKKYGAIYLKKDHHELLKCTDIDAYIVTLPRKLTIGVVKEIVGHGKHVFTEKPLCLNSQNGEFLYHLSKEKKVGVQIGYMKIHDEGTIEFKKKINKLELSDIKCIESFCHMGDSYCNPLGDMKDEILEEIYIKEETLPHWLNTEMAWSYEQFINVFSHITHTTEFIFDNEIQYNNSNINQFGEGFITGRLKGIPLCIRTIRGQQKEWQEGVNIYTNSEAYSIRYPPAFLRNVPAKISISSGLDHMIKEEILPHWSWSFYNQTNAFKALVKNPEHSLKNIKDATRQVKLAETIFKEKASENKQ